MAKHIDVISKLNNWVILQDFPMNPVDNVIKVLGEHAPPSLKRVRRTAFLQLLEMPTAAS